MLDKEWTINRIWCYGHNEFGPVEILHSCMMGSSNVNGMPKGVTLLDTERM